MARTENGFTYSGGVFLMSKRMEQNSCFILRQNSPLPSNSINAIAIDDISGEVFSGTEKESFHTKAMLLKAKNTVPIILFIPIR